MLTIREYKKVESLEEAYTLNQKKSNRVIGGMIWPPWTVIRDRGGFWQCLEDGQNHAKGNCVLFQGGGHGGDFCAAHADTGFDANAGIV